MRATNLAEYLDRVKEIRLCWTKDDKIEVKADAKSISDFLNKEDFIKATRAKGRELVDSMLALAAKLPCKAEAKELSLFIELMAKREF